MTRPRPRAHRLRTLVTAAPTTRTLTLHGFLLAILTCLVLLPYISEPGWGDDGEYWNLGLRMHQQGFAGWNTWFHALRWPVWGMCWLLQGILGFNLASFTGAAFAYMAGGAVICFCLGWTWLRSLRGAWVCGLAYLFHPILDTLCNSPWPDLSEGFWTGGAMLFWWYSTQAQGRRWWFWAALTGFFVFMAQANRLTGVFIVPVLGACTLLFFPRQLPRILAAGAVAALCYLGEMTFYHWLFNDWFHNLHANMKGKGVRGTEAIPLATMPFRFLRHFWGKGLLGPIYSVLALAGIWVAFRRWLPARPAAAGEPAAEPQPNSTLGRVVATWLILHYLLYACAPQSFNPWRPVVREGGRFLGSLVVPISVLAGAALVWLFRQPWLLRLPPMRWMHRHPLPVGAVVLVGLMYAAIPGRPLARLEFLPGMHAYLETVPAGRTVLTHEQMRCLSFMAHSAKAEQLKFLVTKEQLHPDAATLALLPQADEMWYIRRNIFQKVRQLGEVKPQGMITQPAVAPQLVGSEREWQSVAAFPAQEIPDIVFLRRRSADARPAIILEGPALQLSSDGQPKPLQLPITWQNQKKGKRFPKQTLLIPPEIRGTICRLEFTLEANIAEPVDIEIDFPGATKLPPYELRTQSYQQGGLDFFTFPIPPGAERAELDLRPRRGVEWINVRMIRLVCDFPAGPTAK